MNQNSPFKRQLSLRITSASALEKQQRKNSLQDKNDFGKFDTFNFNDQNNFNKINNSVNEEEFSAICKDITQGLNILSKKDEVFDNTTLKSMDSNHLSNFI